MKKNLSALALILVLGIVFAQAVLAQKNKTNVVPFNGMVTDIVGQPLKGVKVYSVDKNFVAKTDKQGRFGLSNVSPTDTIHVLYKGEHYDIPVAGRKSLRIRLGDQVLKSADEDVEMADLGYGFVKRREVIQATNGISGEVLRRTGRTNVLDALQGLVPGLTVRNNSEFGNNATVSMRGVNSINSPITPLFFVDGVEVSSLDFVNIYDVESVEVMKEASIYGSRGANGAILVKTKH
ncbi:MAG: TonB-dependent receptor plug domain-containing protein [Bacteroidales bacterium]|nr:TonB-dependent receptor plug domain-containing protein [Candidatus Liminaster caballi]